MGVRARESRVKTRQVKQNRTNPEKKKGTPNHQVFEVNSLHSQSVLPIVILLFQKEVMYTDSQHQQFPKKTKKKENFKSTLTKALKNQRSKEKEREREKSVFRVRQGPQLLARSLACDDSGKGSEKERMHVRF